LRAEDIAHLVPQLRVGVARKNPELLYDRSQRLAETFCLWRTRGGLPLICRFSRTVKARAAHTDARR
jgi:hypothetical protein